MESGTIVRWLKAVGDRVEKGEPLYELDTEKVTQEVEAEASGVLLEILAGEGDEIEVGKPIAVIGEEGEEVSAQAPDQGDEAPESTRGERADVPSAAEPVSAERPEPEPERSQPEPEPAASAAPAAKENGGRVKASPLARRIARERGIDLSQLVGTGPEGRIVAEDVERAASAPPAWAAPSGAPAEIEVVPLRGMRRTIARRMTEAWQTPHFQISMSADMRAQIRLRERLVAQTREGGTRPTYSDMLAKTCAIALMRHRDVNALFAGEEIHLYPTANVGIAVAVPHGLVVPVIQNCESKSIPEIAEVRADLVERTRAGKLTAGDLEGGTFTISNLGMYGVERFVAILNPPQAAILAVGAIEERAVVEDGAVVVGPRLDLTLSCDHRTIDGATASEFLRTVKDLLEEPGLAL
jgi:pyruvate dehydrogenase E2 component (dihydrolipoamide acetyltransferase)